MAKEIERKFLVSDQTWKQHAVGVRFCQGYISREPGRIVRVRIEGERAVLTIKGKSQNLSRSEWEYPIPMQDAQEMLDELCNGICVDKFRYTFEQHGHTWEVDEFLGLNAGLIVAEIELSSADEEFVKPSWLAEEVSQDPRYANSNLITHPYSAW